MTLPINWNDAGQVRRFFSWSARVGLGPKAGTRPIGWYQIHHDHVYSILTDRGRRSGVARVKKGVVWVGSERVGTVAIVWRGADIATRNQ